MVIFIIVWKGCILFWCVADFGGVVMQLLYLGLATVFIQIAIKNAEIIGLNKKKAYFLRMPLRKRTMYSFQD